MKKEIIVCDKCNKEMETQTSTFMTIFFESYGRVCSRLDLCADCWSEITNQSTKKGGDQT